MQPVLPSISLDVTFCEDEDLVFKGVSAAAFNGELPREMPGSSALFSTCIEAVQG